MRAFVCVLDRTCLLVVTVTLTRSRNAKQVVFVSKVMTRVIVTPFIGLGSFILRVVSCVRDYVAEGFECVSDWLLFSSLYEWLVIRSVGWLIDWFVECSRLFFQLFTVTSLVSRLIDWLILWAIVCCLIDWSSNVDWLIDWLIIHASFMDWSIDCLIRLRSLSCVWLIDLMVQMCARPCVLGFPFLSDIFYISFKRFLL